jgi:hypothetical protein
MAGVTPGPEAIFDPFCWVLKNQAPSPDTITLSKCSGGPCGTRLLDLENYRLRYEFCKLENLVPKSQHLPLAPDGSLHTGNPSSPPGLKIDTGSPITVIYEEGCSTAAGEDAEGPRHSGSLARPLQLLSRKRLSLCSCTTLHIPGWHSRRAVHPAGS